MTSISTYFPRAFAVWFSDFQRWDPDSFQTIDWHWPPDIMKPIGSVLKKRKEKVDKNTFSFEDLQPITIHFDGSIDKRNVEEGREYSMDLFFARPGDIVVAKIDLKNGAVGIIPERWNNVVVTSHFAVYEPDRKKIIPEYFHRIIQTNFFRAHLWSNKVGAEGRKEVKLDFFEAENIPVPSLPLQEAILNRWEQARDEITQRLSIANSHALEIENALLNLIGISILPPTQRRGAFVLPWNALERWDIFFYRLDFVNLDDQLSKISTLPLGDILNFVSRPWTSTDFPNETFEYIEISNVSKGESITGSRPVSINNAPSRATTRIKAGDILISTTRPYLGAFAIVPEKYDNCVCSSGFAVGDGLKTGKINKEFLLLSLKSFAGLKQMERRMTGGLYPAIVQGELEKIKIPMPDYGVQIEFVRKSKEAMKTINVERQAAEKRKSEIEDEIEQLILGTKKIGDIT